MSGPRREGRCVRGPRRMGAEVCRALEAAGGPQLVAAPTSVTTGQRRRSRTWPSISPIPMR